MRLFPGIALAIGIIASPIFAAEEEIGEPGIWTDWDTVLTVGIDTGWTGVWTLQAAVVSVGAKAIQFPLAGHTLSIDYHGNYTMDYKTAHMLTSSYVQMPVFTGFVDWIPPAGLMPSGVPDSCAETGQVSGFAGGKLFAPFDVDLDRLTDDGAPQFGLPWMEARFDPALAVKPKVVCPGNDIDVVLKGGAPMPVGAGRGAVTSNGQVVVYDYKMNPELTVLIMRSRGNPKITYVWVK